jgi:ABC-type nitrate/sulfonate/bicarbonate transport system substrate-binding protein
MLNRLGASHLIAFLFSLISSVTAAQNLQPLSVIAFPGAGNWPIRIAQDMGYFAQYGLEVTLTPTPNSVFQLTNLIEGKFDIGVTSIDNVIAYQEGQGEVAVSKQPDLFVFMGGSPSIPALVTIPDVKTYPDIKGRMLAVDAMTTGYAFVLFDLLKRSGLQSSDYKVEAVGGTLERWKGMQEGKYAAGILNPPITLIAKSKGFNILDYAKDTYGHYEESVATTRRSWATANEQKLVSYIKAYVTAVEWLRYPTNKKEAISILRKYFPQLSADLAEATYADFVGRRGIAAKAQLDIPGVRKVLELRSEYGVPKKVLTDPMRYYDPRYYESAIR